MMIRTFLAALMINGYLYTLSADDTAYKPDTETRRWILIEVFNESVIRETQGDVFLVFDNESLRYEGFAGCNQILGAFETAPYSAFRFTSVSTTKGGCDDPYSLALESRLAETLVQVDHCERRDDKLVFFIGEQKALVFVAEGPAISLFVKTTRT